MEVRELVPIDYCGQRVLTSAQLAGKYGITTNVIKGNYRRAKEYFVEGVDYFKLSGAELRALKEWFKEVKKFDPPSPIPKMTNCLYLWTHKGCVRHCKMVNTPADVKSPVAQVDKAELLARIKKQFAKNCAEFAIVYVLLLSNLIVKIGYTTNPTERFKKIRS